MEAVIVFDEITNLTSDKLLANFGFNTKLPNK